MTLLLAFLIGLFNGLRSLTAPAVTAWAVHLGWLRIEGPLSLIGSVTAVVIFTVLALAELVVDKLPSAPNRTAPTGLIARILMDGLTGACVAGGGQRAFLKTILNTISDVVSCFDSYKTRTGLVKTLGTQDIYVAL